MQATTNGANAIYLFIAELNGYKVGTAEEKLEYGKACYVHTKLHNPDITTEAGRKDFHEGIWLQRLYKDLDNFYGITSTMFLSTRRTDAILAGTHTNYKWTVPIELDAGASMLQVIGALLGSTELLTMTNVIGTTLSDPWSCEGIPRTMFKHASTPMLYGSSKACHELWQDNGHKYTMEQVHIYNKALQAGGLAQANAFKEFIINYCKPSPTMLVDIDGCKFTIECNRYKNIGDITTKYDIYDSVDETINEVYHTHTHKEPDLDQFRRYFVTLLI